MNEWVRRALPTLFVSTGLLLFGAAAHAEEGVGNSNGVEAPISVPVDVCGNAASVLGQAEAGCEEVAEQSQSTVGPQGAAPQGAAPEGAAPEGQLPEAAVPQGAVPEGATPQEELPLTGASVGWLVGAATLLVAGGASLLMLARRRVRRGAHVA